ncbi:hypothetical protein [Enterococcus gallinarum]|uniref:hypothetical protein n=1 Tax=Enterococcus gallinarum TaxID=1353 RepID=UPI001D17743A|nr:hypothetical protein [Enterococcus gallinarum]MCC4046485.1 hypothetical protein [Enterococcus gallinarum]
MSEIKTLAKELQDYTRVVGSHNKHIQTVANRLLELTEQPQLNENQKALVIWMQDNDCETDDPLESISDLFLEAEASSEGWETCLSAAYKSLTNRKKAEMVQKYLEQYLEQEEE